MSCDEHVCLCVCLSTRTSPEPNARSLPIFLCTLPMAVARSSSGRVTKSLGKTQFWGFSSRLTIHCNAFAAKGISLSAEKGGGDGSAQRGRSVIVYGCFVVYVVFFSFYSFYISVYFCHMDHVS